MIYPPSKVGLYLTNMFKHLDAARVARSKRSDAARVVLVYKLLSSKHVEVGLIPASSRSVQP